MNTEYCECDECKGREEACQFDCDLDNLCIGCVENKVYQEEVRAEYERS